MGKGAFFAVFLLGCFLSQNVCADVGFSTFSIGLDNDQIKVGDNLKVALNFKGPDASETAALEIKILVDDVTVYRDDDYGMTFVEGEDKTVYISSTDFPGPDLYGDFWGKNLMNRVCDDHEIAVEVGGGDLDDDYEDSVDFSVGDDDDELSLDLNPKEPNTDEDMIVEVYDEEDDELNRATVKLTWLDDPNGKMDGEWDPKDKSYSHSTNSDGEARFNIQNNLGKNAMGKFQLDAYADGYCLGRQTFEIINELVASVSPASVESGQPFSICVKNTYGESIYDASIHITGPSYSKTYSTMSNGCVDLSIATPGQFQVSAGKSGYEPDSGQIITVTGKAASTSTVSTTLTTSSTATTTTIGRKAINGKLTVSPKKQAFYTGETIEVTVKNRNDEPVGGATVTAGSTNIKGTTDREGGYRFSIDKPGSYAIHAENNDYLPGEETINVTEPQQQPTTTQTGENAKGGGGGGSFQIPALSTVEWLLILLAALLVILIMVIVWAIYTRKPKEPQGLFEPNVGSKLETGE